MTESTETFMIEQAGWLFKIQRARSEKDQRVLALIHGWTGDENVMSIFARRTPENYWLVYPRGPIAAPSGGYGWLDRQDPDHDYPSYREIALQLWDRIVAWKQGLDLNETSVHLMGFSQGAAICYTLAAEHPDQTGRVAALAGYLPKGIQSIMTPGRLDGKQFFIAHGNQDTTIPIDRARDAVSALESAGAQVTFCEDDVGHKLSAACFRGLGKFFA